jgi:hypothetical protein
MDFLKKIYLVKISTKSTTEKKSIANNKNKRSTMLKKLNSNGSALSDYSDDDDNEEDERRSHRQNSLRKVAARRPGYLKRQFSNTVYLHQNSSDNLNSKAIENQLLSLSIEVTKSNSHLTNAFQNFTIDGLDTKILNDNTNSVPSLSKSNKIQHGKHSLEKRAISNVCKKYMLCMCYIY